MGLWSRLFGRTENGTAPRIKLKGPGHFATHIVGESDHHQILTQICGGRRERGVEKIVTAELVPDDQNPLDQTAVGINISGRPIGNLNGLHARNFRDRMRSNGHSGRIATCKAKIKGEWDRGDGGEAHFGVSLDLPHEYTESMNIISSVHHPDDPGED